MSETRAMYEVEAPVKRKRPDWRRTERRIAARLGGKRIPVSGRARGDAADIAHDWLAVEVKHRERLPQWLQDAMSQAVAAAGPDQLPIVVLHEAGQKHGNDLVLLRLADFQDWFGGCEYHNNGTKEERCLNQSNQ